MLDIIGKMQTTGEYDSSGNEIVKPQEIQGWYVNSPKRVIGWENYEVSPVTPRRVFAGAKTIFYTFESEEQFNSLIKTTIQNENGDNVEVDITLEFYEDKKVPSSVTMRQARLALLRVGLLEQVNQIINELPSPEKENAQIEWNHAQEVQRRNSFVDLLAPSIGLTDEQVNDLFILASTL